MKMKDTKGKMHKIAYIPNDGFGARAYVITGVFSRIESIAAGHNAVDNLLKRLENMGWEKVD